VFLKLFRMDTTLSSCEASSSQKLCASIAIAPSRLAGTFGAQPLALTCAAKAASIAFDAGIADGELDGSRLTALVPTPHPTRAASKANPMATSLLRRPRALWAERIAALSHIGKLAAPASHPTVTATRSSTGRYRGGLDALSGLMMSRCDACRAMGNASNRGELVISVMRLRLPPTKVVSASTSVPTHQA
jgi:hypothetical protein